MVKVTDTATRLKQYMDENGLKQVDIIEMCKPYFDENTKLTKSKLSQYVTGVYTPKNDMLYLLAKGLGVSELWLMGYDDTEPDESTGDFRQRIIDENHAILKALEKATPEERKTIKKIIKSIVSDD